MTDNVQMPKTAPLETVAQEDANIEEANRLRSIAKRRQSSACDAIALIRMEHEIANLKIKAEAKMRIDAIHRDTEQKLTDIALEFEKRLLPAQDLLKLVEKLIF